MSVITPDAPAFNRPTPPTPDTHRDSEMLNYYFDAAWTTKDIAEHFKLSVAVVAAWFQHPDIAALIDFIAAANERRARDIARESLPGTIDILQRISRQPDNDKVACAASNALIRLARGPSAAKPKRASKQAETQEPVQSNAPDRSRGAEPATPRDAPHATNMREIQQDASDHCHADDDRAVATTALNVKILQRPPNTRVSL